MKPDQSLDRSCLERLLSLAQAGEQLQLDEPALLRLVEDGVLWAAVLPDGSLGISQASLQELLPREQLPDYKEFAHLQGEPISISDAARKYEIQTSTLTRWMQRGYIARLGKDGRRTLLDEADVAYCAKVYRSDSGQGKWAFGSDGKPYRKSGK